MGLFKTLLKLGKAKSDEAAENIENKNMVSFAKQDITNMEEDLRKARLGLGTVKAKVMGLERDIKAKNQEITERTATVKQLKEAGKVELAKKIWEVVAGLKDEVVVLEGSLTQFQTNYKQQQSNVDKLESNFGQAKRSLQMMKTMDEVKKSNESLSNIDTTGSATSLSRFQERQKKMQEELDKSTAILDASQDSSEDLDAQAAAALGTVGRQDEFDLL